MHTLPPSTHDPVARRIHQLGHAGLIPFAGLCALSWLVNEDALPYVALTLVAYAALIASFLGGIHWGVAWLSEAGGLHHALPPAALNGSILWGVTPSLLAWPGVLMPAYAALPWLGCVLIACYWMDRRLYPAAGLSGWLTLRFRLSTVAALSCFLAAGAV